MKVRRLLLGSFLVLALVAAALAALAQEAPGLRFVTGPADGATVAMAGAKRFARGGIPDGLKSRPPLPIYDLKSDEIAIGKGLETSQTSGFQYLIESSAGFVGAAEVRPAARGGSALMSFGSRGFGPATVAAIDFLSANDRVKTGTFEVRLINAPALQLIAVWLKSEPGGTDLIYPLSEAYSRYQVGKLYTADEFLKPFWPAPSNARWTSDAEMHAYFIDRFLESQGNGADRMSAPLMVIEESMRVTLNTNGYKLQSLELIGIANHQSPVAFTTHRHSGTVIGGETRALTEFEQQALDKLRAGAEVTSQAYKSDRVVVGAVRARMECLQCHNRYRTGDLLGALSYRLIPVKN